MDIETQYKINRYKMRLKRYAKFDWKVYFLKTFGFLLLFFIFMLIISPDFFINIQFLNLIAIGLWIMIFVCAILTPIIYFWYQFRYGTLKKELDELLVNNSKVSSIDGKESTKVEDVKSDEEDVEKKD